MTGGVFGVTAYRTGLSAEQATQQWSGAAGTSYAGLYVNRPVNGLKVYFTQSDGSGYTGSNKTCFPQTITAGSGMQTCIDMGMTAFLCYAPSYTTSTFTYNSAGVGNSPDYVALQDSLTALSGLGLKIKVILFQEIEYSPQMTAADYFETLAYYAPAISAALGSGGSTAQWGAEPFGTATWPAPLTSFETATGTTVTTMKIYPAHATGSFTMPVSSATISANTYLQYCIANPSVRACVCLLPAYNDTDAANLATSLANLKAANLNNAVIILGEEVQNYGATAGEFITMMQSCYSVVQEYYPGGCVYNAAGSSGLTQWEAYNPGSAYWDILAIDLYATSFWNQGGIGGTADPAGLVSIAHAAGKPWGLYEIGASISNETPPPETGANSTTAYIEYLTSLVAADLNAGLPVDCIMWYYAPAGNENNNPAPFATPLQALAQVLTSGNNHYMFHDASANGATNWSDYVPGPPNVPNALVHGAIMDFYGTSYINGCRVDVPFKNTYSYLDMCTTAGIPFHGFGEIGTSDGNAPVPTNAQAINFIDYIYTIISGVIDNGYLPFFMWYEQESKNVANCIPGYSYGQSATVYTSPGNTTTQVGPNMVPELQKIADLISGGLSISPDIAGTTDSVSIHTTASRTDTEAVTDSVSIHLKTTVTDTEAVTDSAALTAEVIIVGPAFQLPITAPAGTISVGATASRPDYSPGILGIVTHPINDLGTDVPSSVVATSTFDWNVLNSVVSDSPLMKWDTEKTLSSTSVIEWDTTTRISSSASFAWANYFRVDSTAEFGWNTIYRESSYIFSGAPVLLGPVTHPIDAPSTYVLGAFSTWNTQERIAATKTIEWNFLNSVKSTADFEWNVRLEHIVVPPDIEWNTLKRVTSTASFGWNTRKAVASTSAVCKWNTVGRIQARTMSWWNTCQRISTVPWYGFYLPLSTWDVFVVQPRVKSSRSFGWNTLYRISTSEAETESPGLLSPVVRPIDYGVPAPGEFGVSEWNTLKRVTSTASFGWNAVGRIPSRVSCRWDMDGRVSSATACTWNTTARYDSVKSIKWNYLKGVTSTPPDIEWNTLKHVTSTPPDIEWNDVGRIHSVATCEWNTTYTDPATKTFNWNTLKRVTSTQSCGWNTAYEHVTSTASCTWDVDERASVAFTCEWVTLKSVVSVPPAIEWDVGQPVQIGKRLVAPSSWSKME